MTDETVTNPTIEVQFLPDGNLQVSMQGVDSLKLWACARWLQRYGDALHDAQMIAAERKAKTATLEVAQTFPKIKAVD